MSEFSAIVPLPSALAEQDKVLEWLRDRMARDLRRRYGWMLEREVDEQVRGRSTIEARGLLLS